ncbi:DUF2784 domain-containing protein [Georgenia sp. AZ-5]|uniref:DUF2784 domain-containing protein n=1 Tax=Georgenia sp. AZ-5 TaxID=3367526 RepID=UPI0037545A8D
MDGVLADLTMAAHFGYLLYMVVGGFVAWRWSMTIVAHFMAVAWGGLAVIFSWDCPLTVLENVLRRRAGEPDLGDQGFIATYLTGQVYPEEYLGLVRFGAGVIVTLSWVGYVVMVLSRRRARLARLRLGGSPAPVGRERDRARWGARPHRPRQPGPATPPLPRRHTRTYRRPGSLATDSRRGPAQALDARFAVASAAPRGRPPGRAQVVLPDDDAKRA